MDGEEKVRILAWIQESVIMKKSADVLRARSCLMTLLAAAPDLPQDVIPATKA